MKILVTGANGFVGKELCKASLQQDYILRAVVRSELARQHLETYLKQFSNNFEVRCLPENADSTAWLNLVEGVDVVVHLVARVHRVNEVGDHSQEYFKVNVELTRQLAQSAAKAGVKRFIYLSSIKVNGEKTVFKPYHEDDVPQPVDDYGRTKLQAEKALIAIAEQSTLEYVILRPPLVYGAGAKANFKNLVAIIEKGLPLPLAGVNNKRSFIYIGNLVAAIIACLNHSAARNQLYLLSDGQDASTAELIQYIAKALNKPVRLWPVPLFLLRFFGKLLGKSAMVAKLLDSLVVDSSKIRSQLVWQSPYTFEQALQQDFMQQKQ